MVCVCVCADARRGQINSSERLESRLKGERWQCGAVISGVTVLLVLRNPVVLCREYCVHKAMRSGEKRKRKEKRRWRVLSQKEVLSLPLFLSLWENTQAGRRICSLSPRPPQPPKETLGFLSSSVEAAAFVWRFWHRFDTISCQSATCGCRGNNLVAPLGG